MPDTVVQILRYKEWPKTFMFYDNGFKVESKTSKDDPSDALFLQSDHACPDRYWEMVKCPTTQ